jgi:hypothetical protein
MNPGEPGDEDGWPKVAAMVTVNNLDTFAPGESSSVHDALQLERSIGRGRMERHPQVAGHFGELAPIRAGEPDRLAQLVQTMH